MAEDARQKAEERVGMVSVVAAVLSINGDFISPKGAVGEARELIVAAHEAEGLPSPFPGDPGEAPLPMEQRLMIDGVPRRNRVDHYSEAELAIRSAVDVVERTGAHPWLTEAVILLGKAQDRVADFVDTNPTLVAAKQ